MDLLLSRFQKAFPKVTISQSKSLFYNEFKHRLRLKFGSRKDPRRVQRAVLYQHEDTMTRAEGKMLSLFFADETELFRVISTLDKISVDHSKTATNFIYELSADTLGLETKTIYVPTLKKKGFNYRITFQTGFRKFYPEMKQKVLNLIEQDPDNFKITPETNKWLKNPVETSNYYTKYIYIKDEALITYMQLSCRDIISQVYKII